jgi:hypothetical protein
VPDFSYYGSPFFDCQIEGESGVSIVMTDTVASIGKYAFHKSNDYNDHQIGSVIIGNSVTSTGQSAFYNNQITSVTLGNSMTTIGYYTFKNNLLTEIIIPASVTTIHRNAFDNNLLTEIIIPASVTSIGESAFDTNQLTSVTLPASVISIGINAFANNPSLTKLTASANFLLTAATGVANVQNAVVEVLGHPFLSDAPCQDIQDEYNTRRCCNSLFKN